MATLPCSICGEHPAIATFTDLDDGTAISPCPIHLDELAEYVVSMMQAFDEAMAIANGDTLGAEAKTSEADAALDEMAAENADTEPDPKHNGRSRAKSDVAATDTAAEATTDEALSTVAPSQSDS